MTELVYDGFDKYGPYQNSPTSSALIALLNAADWTWSSTTGTIQLVAPLSALGAAIQTSAGTYGVTTIGKTLGANYSRLVGGIRFNPAVLSGNAGTGGFIQFSDAATVQCGLTIDPAGTISFRQGGVAGTAVAVGGSIAIGATHYLEWDVTFGPAGSAYQVWLDKVSLFSGTTKTIMSANSYANVISFGVAPGGGGNATVVWDDTYHFNTLGSTNNAVLLTNPVVETTWPISDSAVQFTVGAGVLGYAFNASTTSVAPGANKLFLLPFTPTVNCTIASISCLPETTSTTANTQAVIYGTTSGVAHSLLSAGTTVTGTTAGTVLTSALTTPQALIAGTQYWLGFITDTSIALLEFSTTSLLGVSAANTFTSGAPATAPTMTTGAATWQIWGNLTAMAHNYPVVADNPQLGALGYVTSNTVGNADLYGFTPLSTTSNPIYSMAIKGVMAVPSGGARTANLQVKSGSATGNGSASGFSQTTSPLGYVSYFSTDPSTGSAWTTAGHNAATAGPAIAS